MADERIKREIEDILSRLDDLPAERKPIPIKRARQARRARDLPDPLRHISVRNAMLASLVIIVIGFFGMRAIPYGQWFLIGGLLLFAATFAISFLGRSTTTQARYEKRWRGQPMELEPAAPSFGDRLRTWFNSKRR